MNTKKTDMRKYDLNKTKTSKVRKRQPGRMDRMRVKREINI